MKFAKRSTSKPVSQSLFFSAVVRFLSAKKRVSLAYFFFVVWCTDKQALLCWHGLSIFSTQTHYSTDTDLSLSQYALIVLLTSKCCFINTDSALSQHQLIISPTLTEKISTPTQYLLNTNLSLRQQRPRKSRYWLTNCSMRTDCFADTGSQTKLTVMIWPKHSTAFSKNQGWGRTKVGGTVAN